MKRFDETYSDERFAEKFAEEFEKLDLSKNGEFSLLGMHYFISAFLISKSSKLITDHLFVSTIFQTCVFLVRKS